MAFSTAFRNAAVDAVAVNGGASWFSLHYSDPGTAGTGEVTGGTYARVQSVYPAATGGSAANTGATINVPASANPLTHWARWTAQTGGTVYASGALPAAEVFGSAGTYTLTNSVVQPSE